MRRRQFTMTAILATLGFFPTLRWAGAASPSRDDRIILHQNWILKSSDLER